MTVGALLFLTEKGASLMNRHVRDIYADYQYDMLQLGLTLKDLASEPAVPASVIENLLDRAERLEALIDLYAYLLACQGGSRR